MKKPAVILPMSSSALTVFVDPEELIEEIDYLPEEACNARFMAKVIAI